MGHIFKSLYEYLIKNRRKGYTTTLEKIAKKFDVLILVPYLADKDRIKNSICLAEMRILSMKENKKPILLDNSTLLKLCEAYGRQEDELRKANYIISEKNKTLQAITQLIKNQGNDINRRDIR